MVQIAPMLSINERDRKGNELAKYLEAIVNEYAEGLNVHHLPRQI